MKSIEDYSTYRQLLRYQNYKCAACFTTINQGGGAPGVRRAHIHIIGKYRSLLCTQCLEETHKGHKRSDEVAIYLETNHRANSVCR